MNFVGLYLGDATNQAHLRLRCKSTPIQEKVVEENYRAVDGSMGRQLVRGIVPMLTLTLDLLDDTTLAILRGARVQRDPLYLRFSKGQSVMRQLEVLETTTTFHLTPNSFSDIASASMKVYLQSDFTGGSNLFSSWDQATFVVTVTPAQTAGAKVYVDYTWKTMKCFLTQLSVTPYRGGYRKWWTVQATFEGM